MSGADLTPEQWDRVVEILKARQLIPFLDIAYQGFGPASASRRWRWREWRRHPLPALRQSPGRRCRGTVLLHPCCHNPTGADLTPEQWDRVVEILKARQLIPFLDISGSPPHDPTVPASGRRRSGCGSRGAAAQCRAPAATLPYLKGLASK
jgi:aspartate/tyrosine/aromatic aminotransferase